MQPVIYRRGVPVLRTDLGWDDAFRRIIEKLKASRPTKRSGTSAAAPRTKPASCCSCFARLYGTNNVNNCSFYCHQASGVGLMSSIGSGTATIVLDDVEHADCVFVIGGNPASNHPRLMSTLMQCPQQGRRSDRASIRCGELGLVNFRIPSNPWSLLFGTKIASLYIQPHIGGDLALLTGVAKRIDEMSARRPHARIRETALLPRHRDCKIAAESDLT